MPDAFALTDAYSSLDPFTFVSKAGIKPEVKKENKPLLTVQPTIDGKPASEGMKRSNSGNAKKPFPEHLLADLSVHLLCISIQC